MRRARLIAKLRREAAVRPQLELTASSSQRAMSLDVSDGAMSDGIKIWATKLSSPVL